MRVETKSKLPVDNPPSWLHLNSELKVGILLGGETLWEQWELKLSVRKGTRAGQESPQTLKNQWSLVLRLVGSSERVMVLPPRSMTPGTRAPAPGLQNDSCSQVNVSSSAKWTEDQKGLSLSILLSFPASRILSCPAEWGAPLMMESASAVGRMGLRQAEDCGHPSRAGKHSGYSRCWRTEPWHCYLLAGELRHLINLSGPGLSQMGIMRVKATSQCRPGVKWMNVSKIVTIVPGT